MLVQKNRFLQAMITLLFLLISTAIFELDISDQFSQRFSAPVNIGQIQSDELSEISGMVASIKNNGSFWVINDSGNTAKLYLIDLSGHILSSYELNNTSNVDWEDIAIMVDQKTGASKIVIADIGDNMAIRDHVKIIIVDEPDTKKETGRSITPSSTYRLKYEDGARDAETLLIDPISNKLFIVSKREDKVRLYELPPLKSSEGIQAMTFKQSFELKSITSGAISADGSEILLKNYSKIYYWKRSEDQSLMEVLRTKHELLNYNPEPQGESITWNTDASGFYTLSEKSWAPKQIMYFYERTKGN